MPKTKHIEIDTKIDINEARMAKIVNVLSSQPLEVIILTRIEFFPAELERLFRFQAHRLLWFEMCMPSGTHSIEGQRNNLALLECAIKWTPNMQSLRRRPLLDDRTVGNPAWANALMLLKSKVHLRCPDLDLEAWEKVLSFCVIPPAPEW